MAIKIKYRGRELEFERLPTPEALNRAYQEQIRSDSSEMLVERLDRGGSLPLSLAQRRLWVLDQLTPDGNAYNNPRSIRWIGALDLRALAVALGAVAARHEVLRTRVMTNEAGQPAVYVSEADAFQVPLSYVDLTPFGRDGRERRAEELAIAEMRQPFRLAEGPLVRVLVLKVAEDDYSVVVTMHHIISDQWSMGVFVEDVAAHYRAERTGESPGLTPLPFQYADFAAWQRDCFERDKRVREHFAYWKERLEGVPPLDLPLDHDRPRVLSHAGAARSFALDVDLCNGLRRLGASEGATLFMALAAGFAVVLHRLSNQNTIALGTPTAARQHEHLARLIGFFVNTLVVRVDLPAGATVRDAIRTTRDSVIAAFKHQDVPFDQIVDAIQVDRDLSRTPLFQAMFALQTAPPDAALPGVQLRPWDVDHRVAQFDVSVVLTEERAGLKGTLEYNTDLFDPETAQRLVEQYRSILRGMIATPDVRVSLLPLLSQSEFEKLLGAARATAIEWPAPLSLYGLFQKQVAARRHAPALLFQESVVSFGELERRVTQVEVRLRACGAQRGEVIGVCLERGVDLVATLLAVVSIGAAYLPLEPEHPASRSRFALDNSKCRLLVTDTRLAERLGWSGAALRLDGEGDSCQGSVPPAGAHGLAYVIYTSGSTGQPNGVAVEEQAVVNILRHMEQALALTPLDRWVAITTVAFDISVLELFAPLCTGGAVVLATTRQASDGKALLQLLKGSGGTIFQGTPAAYHLLLEAGMAERPLLVRHWLCGGEAVPSPLVASMRPCGGTFSNVYGPTETTVWSTMGALDGDPVTVGRPIANTQVYILNEELEPVPIGVAGEIYVGGRGLSRGYPGQPALTAARFVPHPFSECPGARLYRTGDIGRYLRDGRIVHLGRRDHQVKIRGYRIELGEIEAQLGSHPNIIRAAVAPIDGVLHRRLVAYLVARGPRVSHSALVTFLAETLPAYMIPSSFEWVDSLPLSPNGKVDRTALPAPSGARPSLPGALVAPRTDVERALVDVWREALGLADVGVHDNFFELGGDSILSIQVSYKARARGLHVTPTDVFHHQTVAGLATVTTRQPPMSAEQGRIVGVVPLMHMQCWALEQEQPTLNHWNQAMLFEVAGGIESEVFERATRQVADHHDMLRVRFSREGGRWTQICHDCAVVAFERRDLHAVGNEQLATEIDVAAAQMHELINVSDGPLFAVLHLQLGRGRPDRVLFVMHMLITDGISWRIMLEDIDAAYQALMCNTPLTLPAKTTSFRDWGNRLITYSTSAELRVERTYWQAIVSRGATALPVDNPGGTNLESDKGVVTVALSADETSQLLQRVPAAYRTQVNDILLTALSETLSEWTKRDENVIEFESHGRENLFEDVDLTRTIGRFVALYPLCLRLASEEDPGRRLQATKEQLRAVPHGGIGFGILRHLARDSAFTGADPELCYNYLGQVDQGVSAVLPFSVAHESSGPAVSPQQRHRYKLYVVAAVAGGRMTIEWTFSRSLHHQQTVETLARRQLQRVRALIAHCTIHGAGGYTASDFPLAPLSREQLEELYRRDASVESVFPLSPLQEGVLLHHRLVPESIVYNRRLVARIDGVCDPDIMSRAWSEVVSRNPILRTVFWWDGVERPLQVVRRYSGFDVERAEESGEPPRELETFVAKLGERRFELDRAPPFHVKLVDFGANRRLLTVDYSQILLDGWSLVLLMHDVFTWYAAALEGAPALSPRRRPYRDYIAWLGRQSGVEAERYWGELLGGFRSPVRLGRGVHSGRQVTNHERAVNVSERLSTALREACRSDQITTGSMFQGLFGLLLALRARVDDLVVGVTVATRPPDLGGSDTMVGLLINTLPLRIRVEGDVRLGVWLSQLQQQLACSRAFDYTPLWQVQGCSELQQQRDLFDAIIIVENQAVDPGQLPAGLVVKELHEVDQTPYAISFRVVPEPVVRVHASYDPAQLDAASVEVLLSQYLLLLETYASSGARPISDLRLLNADDRQRAIQGWNRTAVVWPGEDLCAQIESQVTRQPSAIAVSSGTSALSYEQLWKRAGGITRELVTRGLKRGDLVAVCVERGVDLLVALIGVLRAGAAYVPLDPEYPEQRLRFILEDSGAVAAVADRRGQLKLAEFSGFVIGPEVGAADCVSRRGSGLAYVIYTSGSTGRPKGVAVAETSLLNVLRHMSAKLELNSHDTWLSVTTVSFDIAALELFCPLLVGACVVVASTDEASSGLRLGQRLEQSRATIFQATPSSFRLLLDADLTRRDLKLRHWLCGGEAMPASVALEMASIGGCLHNVYGPTETTIWSSTGSPKGDVITLGRPVANTEMYVLDERLEPVAVGVVGEIYIGGQGVAWGYHRRPMLTAERFIPDPLSDREGSRLYTTGDLGKYLPDGRIQHLGRVDQQIKLHGHRIELGEVEAILAAHPDVTSAAAALVGQGPQARLVAYVTLCEGRSSEADLRRWMQPQVPSYMVPSSVAVLQALPRLPNGKLDRSRLPALDHGEGRSGELGLPKTRTQRELIRIWKRALQIEQLGVEDSFFDLGGNSLTAARVLDEVRRTFGYDIPLREVFDRPTISELSSRIDAQALAEVPLVSRK